LRELQNVALEANQRYVEQFVERLFLCPFAQGARQAGETIRRVLWLREPCERQLLDIMFEAANDPGCVVFQLILPCLDCEPDGFISFCRALTDRGHFLLQKEVLAVAALHPHLSYTTQNPHTVIPLFRRAPDPTVQWIRLDVLEEVHAGREKGSTFIDPAVLMAMLTEESTPKSLYDKIAEANYRMAQRHGMERLAGELAELSTETQTIYRHILSPAR
jgi:hypothetical protein